MARKMNAARAEHRVEAEASAEPQIQQYLWPEAYERSAQESPARRLQLDLEENLAKPSPDRWSARRSLLFIFAANALLWTGVVAGLRSLF